MSHTPGPWIAEQTERVETGLDIIIKNKVEKVVGWAYRPSDARLIAAAPEMLEALKAAEQFIQNGRELGYITVPDMPDDPALKVPGVIRAAIAKATSTDE